MNYNKQLISVALIAGTLFGVAANAAVPYNNRCAGNTVCAKLFSGPYINAGAGLSQQRYHSTGTGENSVIKSHVGLGFSDITPFGLYMAGEVRLGMNNTLRDKVGLDVFNNLGTSQGYETKVTATNNNVATLLKLGTPVFNNSVLYGIAGPDVSGFKVKTKSGGNTRSKDSMNVGLVLGAGFDTYITQNVTVGLEYTNTVHRGVKSNNLREFFSDLGAGNLEIDNKKHKVESNAVVMNLAYHFDFL